MFQMKIWVGLLVGVSMTFGSEAFGNEAFDKKLKTLQAHMKRWRETSLRITPAGDSKGNDEDYGGLWVRVQIFFDDLETFKSPQKACEAYHDRLLISESPLVEGARLSPYGEEALKWVQDTCQALEKNGDK